MEDIVNRKWLIGEKIERIEIGREGKLDRTGTQ